MPYIAPDAILQYSGIDNLLITNLNFNGNPPWIVTEVNNIATQIMRVCDDSFSDCPGFVVTLDVYLQADAANGFHYQGIEVPS